MSYEKGEALGVALAQERDELIQEIKAAFADLTMLTAEAFMARAEGDLAKSRQLLNDALDIECDVTGDCRVLGDLAEEWGVDHDEDRPDRKSLS